jgi:tetratricopeptide (TPR) repeat protein
MLTLASQEYQQIMMKHYTTHGYHHHRHNSLKESEIMPKESPTASLASSPGKREEDPYLSDLFLYQTSLEHLDCLLLQCHCLVLLEQYVEAQGLIQHHLARYVYLYTQHKMSSHPTSEVYLSSLNIDMKIWYQLKRMNLSNPRALFCLQRIMSIYCRIYYHYEEYAEALIYYHILYQLLLQQSIPRVDFALDLCLEVDQLFEASALNFVQSQTAYKTREMAKLMHNIATVFYAMKNLEKAKDMLEQALVILLRRCGDEYMLV